ncbi:MAG: carotenoid oxygenase family protein [Pseudomonadales bacterium]
MSRRQFLQHSALIASTLGTGTLAQARLRGADSWQQQFATALANKPWLGGYQSVSQAAFEGPTTLRGKVPVGLKGTLYRNGPAQHEIGDARYQHWFDGDGMLQAWRFEGQRIRHQARMIATPKYQAERAAGRMLYPGFGTALENGAPVTEPDSINPANISVLAHHDKLYALWEAGSAVEMDPDSLETIGLHAFSDDTDGVPFSAHPRVEADGTLWNFGYLSNNSLLVLWHLDVSGNVKKAGLIPLSPMSMPHDFVVTAKHLVIMIPPMHYEPDNGQPASFLASHRWHPERATRVLVIDKDNFENYQTYELPAQWVFHYGNGWEDSNGVIHFDAARAASPAAMTETFRDVMRGELQAAPPSRHYQYRIDTRKQTITESAMFSSLSDPLESEFPTIDPRISGQRNQQLVMLTASPANPTPHGLLNTVSRYRLDQDQLEHWTYPISQIPEEHLFVPAPGSAPETRGWIVGSAFDYTRNRSLLNVFDAEQLADGPLCTATAAYGVPLGLHGKFVASR